MLKLHCRLFPWKGPNLYAVRFFHRHQASRCPTHGNEPASSPLPASSKGAKSSTANPSKPDPPPPDHRQLGAALDLFSSTNYSPGSPLLHPDGSHVFLQLQAFLRAQYAAHGFREVVTPTIYKRALWERSGHWQNYRDDMFAVRGGAQHSASVRASPPPEGERAGGRAQHLQEDENDDWGLKPMNCPAHCLLFAARPRSFRDLPLRLADFGALHRDEVSGALAGLTRVRRFHQDDGHIFCTCAQIGEEIARTLQLISLVYEALGMTPYRLVLSTRPEDDGREGAMGSAEEWADAEEQLKQALAASGRPWTIAEGEGAFYGPKIDIVVPDAQGRDHQTATVQLDFQLPRRFELAYADSGPGPSSPAAATPTADPSPAAAAGAHAKPTPVLIHRAVLGSLERFLALLLERRRGQLPFWLSPRQLVLVPTISAFEAHAHALAARLAGTAPAARAALQPLRAATPGAGRGRFCVRVDARTTPMGRKIRDAAIGKDVLVGVVGHNEVEAGTVAVRWQGVAPERLEEVKGEATRLGMGSKGEMSVEGLEELMGWMVDRYI